MSETTILELDKYKWGPFGWHLIHNFSIHSNDNECMYILIKTFGYILPCPTCKKHYNYLINDIYKIEKDNCNKKYLIKYLYDIHNIINDNLEKKKKISFQEAKKLHKKTKNEEIIFFIVTVYSNLNYKKLSFFEFDKIYNFFLCFLKNYPSSDLKDKFTSILNSKKFQESDTPLTFRKWFLKDFISLSFINTYFKNCKKNIIYSI